MLKTIWNQIFWNRIYFLNIFIIAFGQFNASLLQKKKKKTNNPELKQ